MKILYINSVYGKGSTGVIVRDLHQKNLSNGIESYVCYGRGDKAYDKNVFKTSNEFLSKLNALRSKITGAIYSGNIISTNKLIRKIKVLKPDIVHIHNLNDNFVNEYKLLKYLAYNRIKTIITLHSEQMYTASCGYSFECDKWKEGGCKKCFYLKNTVGSFVDYTNRAFKKLKTCYELFDKNLLCITSVSNWLYERSSHSLLLKKFNNRVIPNGTSIKLIEDIDLTDLNLQKNGYFLYVNPRLNDQNKGYQFIEILSNKVQGYLPIVIVGDCTKIKKYKNVVYLGSIYDKRILSMLYAGAFATILLSKRETFSMVAAESLMCGTPVISFECGGPVGTFSNEFVKFVEYGDIHALLNECKHLKCNKKEISAYAKKHFSIDAMHKNYLSLYKEML